MKDIMIIVVGLIGSTAAFAAPIDQLKEGRKYMTYSAACGVELERSGNDIVLTAIKNSFRNDIYCRNLGAIVRVTCVDWSNKCYGTTEGQNSKVEIMNDGNFVINDRAKYFVQ